MKTPWSKTVFPIAAIFSFRMLGLFLLIPVFTLYAAKLQGATPALIGLALGSYGLTQGLLQIPFGILSDKLGRKLIITLGLTLFALGSLLGAFTDSIYGMILARTIQGTGAVGSVLIALLADLTPDHERTKAMAVVGATIGTSFGIAMIISPFLTHEFGGLSGIFYVTTVLAFLGIGLLHWIIPTPKTERFHLDSETKLSFMHSVLKNPHLQRLNLGIFCQHFILTATFFSIPLILNQHIVLGHLSQPWHFYLPLLVISFIIMIPFIILAEKKKLIKPVFLISILTIILANSLLALTSSNWLSLCAFLFIYFIAFNILEATLPSLVSKQANAKYKGTAMGVYSTSQFLGIFAGGALAGLIYPCCGNQGIFIINATLGTLWFIFSIFMQPDVYLSTLILPYPLQENDVLKATLLNLPGVKEVVFSTEEQVIYIQVYKDRYKAGSADSVLAKISG